MTPTGGGEEEEDGEEEEVTEEEEEEEEEEELSTSAFAIFCLAAEMESPSSRSTVTSMGSAPGGGRRDSQKVSATRTSISSF